MLFGWCGGCPKKHEAQCSGLVRAGHSVVRLLIVIVAARRRWRRYWR